MITCCCIEYLQYSSFIHLNIQSRLRDFVRCNRRLAQVDASRDRLASWPLESWRLPQRTSCRCCFSSSVKFNVRGPCHSITISRALTLDVLISTKSTFELPGCWFRCTRSMVIRHSINRFTLHLIY